MSERPTFCPRCLRMHVGVCEMVKRAFIPDVREVSPPEFAALTKNAPNSILAMAVIPDEPAPPKFDKTAYQREYMRRKRAEKAK
jgi:hypothetical protein